ncbi:nucleoside triphosphate pyrophosphohydrolase [bacterium]|nr:nucleoside triphosphate pyrophosphohydrolase [bacterium]
MADTEFQRLVKIMEQLRGPNGCPWDKKQDHASMRQYLIEEAFEVLEALDDGDDKELCLELGDLLLQVVFHAQMASETGRFDIWDVANGINEKLIRRHPHIFGDVTVTSAEEVVVNWEKIKMLEGKKSVVDGVPLALPALLRAFRVQKKASKIGFDWDEIEPVWEKVKEEEAELLEAVRQADPAKIEEEFGDLLFSLVNVSRFLKVNPEDALRATTNKFIRRFQFIEKTLAEQNKSPEDCSLEEMDAIWDVVKATEK